MSRREQVLEAVLAALNTGTPADVPASVRLKRRQDESDRSITFYPVREEVKPKTNRWGMGVERSLTIMVECRVKDEDPDQALDPLHSWAVAALVQQRAFGGLALDSVEQRTEWDFTQREDGFGLATIEFQVNYMTRANDQTASG